MSVRPPLTPHRFAEGASPERPHRRIRPEDVLRTLLIASIVLIAGLVLGSFTKNELIGRGTPYFVLAAGAGVLLTALAYRNIEWVMLAYVAVVWVSVGATPDVAVGTNTGSGHGLALAHIGMAFLLLVWCLRSATRQAFPFVHLPLNFLLVFYLFVNIVSAFNGTVFWDKEVAQYYQNMGDRNGGRTPALVVAFEIVIRMMSLGAFWLFANNLRDTLWVRRASWMLLTPGIVLFATVVLHLPLPVNAYSVLLEIVLACTLFAWLLEPRAAGVAARRGLRFWGWLLLGGLVVQIFYVNLNWVSGWWGLFVGLYTVAFLRSRRLFFGMALLGLCLYVAGQAFLQATVVHKVQTSGDTLRFAMAHAALMYALKFPLGVGVGNYRSYNIYYGSAGKWNTSTFTSAHSFYSQALSESGFLGLIAAVLFIVVGLVMVARFYQKMPPGPSRTFVLGIAGMWAGICAASGIGDYLIPVYYNGAIATTATTIYAWIGLGIAVAHARLYGLVSDAPPQAAEAAPVLPEAAEYYPRRLGNDPS